MLSRYSGRSAAPTWRVRPEDGRTPIRSYRPDEAVWWTEFICETCGRRYAENLGRCPVDGGRLCAEPMSRPRTEDGRAPIRSYRPDEAVWWTEFICETCGRRYAENLGRCPVDGGRLCAEPMSLPFLWLG